MAVASTSTVVITLLNKSHEVSRSSTHSDAFSASRPRFSFQSLDSVRLQCRSSFKNGRFINPLTKESLLLRRNHSASQGMERTCLRASAYPFSWEDSTGSSLYALLGVKQSVEIPEIKRAYRKMASHYHPDVFPREEVDQCTEKFLQLQYAYKVLSDPELRAHYDRHMTNFSDTGIYFSKSERLMSEVVKEHWMRASWKPQWEAQVGRLRWRCAGSAHEESHHHTWAQGCVSKID